MRDKIALKYMNALSKKYEAKMEEALANLELYFSDRVVGIGEHSDLLEEFDKWIAIYTDSKGKLDSLKQEFSDKILINNKINE